MLGLLPCRARNGLTSFVIPLPKQDLADDVGGLQAIDEDRDPTVADGRQRPGEGFVVEPHADGRRRGLHRSLRDRMQRVRRHLEGQLERLARARSRAPI